MSCVCGGVSKLCVCVQVGTFVDTSVREFACRLEGRACVMSELCVWGR